MELGSRCPDRRALAQRDQGVRGATANIAIRWNAVSDSTKVS
jgi:hypothetical protein